MSDSAEPPNDDILKYRQMQKKFRHACKQVVLLNNKIQDVQLRYDRAVKANKRSWRYVTRLNLASIEGVRNMFYEYACRRADELDRMQDRLIEAGTIGDSWSYDEDTDEEMEDRGEQDNQENNQEEETQEVTEDTNVPQEETTETNDEAADIGGRQ